jgi:hypothetical protein
MEPATSKDDDEDKQVTHTTETITPLKTPFVNFSLGRMKKKILHLKMECGQVEQAEDTKWNTKWTK